MAQVLTRGRTPAVRSRSDSIRAHLRRRGALLVACAAAVAYCAVAAARLPGMLTTVYSYSDFPEALKLGDAVFHGAWGQGLLVPQQTGVAPLWLAGLLHQLSGSYALSMATGAALAVAGIFFLARAAGRVVGVHGAALTAALAAAAPPVVAWEFLSPIAHVSTFLLSCLAAWQLVRLSSDTSSRLATSVAVGVIAGVCLVSDPLAAAAAVAPWLLAGAILVRRRIHTLRPLATTAVAGVLSALLVLVAMRAGGIAIAATSAHTPSPAHLSLDAVSAGLRTTEMTLGQMVSGAWYSSQSPAVLSIIGVGVFACVAIIGWSATRRPKPESRADVRAVYATFWLASAAGLIVALCVTGAGVNSAPVNYQGHYVDGLWLCVAALLPLGLLYRAAVRRAAVAACVVLVALSTLGVAAMPAQLFNGPDYRDAAQLVAALRHAGVASGYGGYWESYAVGWDTGGAITALPLQHCSPATGDHSLCRYEFAASAWYRAASGEVFLIVTRDPCVHDDLCIDASDAAALGQPVRVVNAGALAIYLFPHDVFAHLPAATTE